VNREDYILSHIDPEGEYLHRLYRATNLHLLYPHMVSGHLQGRVLKMLVQMIRPHRVLEIGTYSGYSAISMAEGLGDGALLYTVEKNDEQEVFTRPWIEGSAVGDKIRFVIGDALEVVPQLGERFDLVFIDADKRHYTDYYEMVMPLLNKGGLHTGRQHAVGRPRAGGWRYRCADAGHHALQRPGGGRHPGGKGHFAAARRTFHYQTERLKCSIVCES